MRIILINERIEYAPIAVFSAANLPPELSSVLTLLYLSRLKFSIVE